MWKKFAQLDPDRKAGIMATGFWNKKLGTKTAMIPNRQPPKNSNIRHNRECYYLETISKSEDRNQNVLEL